MVNADNVASLQKYPRLNSLNNIRIDQTGDHGHTRAKYSPIRLLERHKNLKMRRTKGHSLRHDRFIIRHAENRISVKQIF